MSAEEIELLIFEATVAEEAERFDEMKTVMKRVALESKSPLTNGTRNLLSVAYKNAVGTRRSSWRILSAIEESLKSKDKIDASKVAAVEKYKAKLEAELWVICNEVQDALKILIERLGSSDTTLESSVFFHKMQGDYYRYLAEFTTGDQKATVVADAAEAYQQAETMATKSLAATSPVRLGLALNYSVFLFETMCDVGQACATAKSAFDNAINDLDSIDEASYRDSTLVMQLLRENLNLWTSSYDKDDENIVDPEN